MKKIFVCLMLSAFVFVSCKKDRSCVCSVVTTFTNTIHTQMAAVSVSVPGLPPPFTIPPIEIVPAKDTTVVNFYTFNDNSDTKYDKVSKKTIKRNCAASSEETFNDASMTIAPGTSTVTMSKSGKKVYTCEIQ